MSRKRRKQHKQTTTKKQIPAGEPTPTWMGLKSIVTIVLLLFVVASVVYLVLSDSPVRGENSGENSEDMALVVATPSSEVTETVVAAPGSKATTPVVTEPSSGSLDQVEDAQHRVIVYYFHGTARCPTCRAIEEYTYEALVTGFPKELESGTLEWRPINVEESPNQHFINDYELVMRSVILADMVEDNQTRWKNLERIWELGNKDAFISYIQEETTTYLEGN